MELSPRVVTRSIHLLVVLLALMPVWPLAANAENSVSVAVSGGERTAHISAVTFYALRVEHDFQYQHGTATITIDDSSGTNAGWSVAIVHDDRLGSPRIAIGNVSAPRRLAGQAIAPHGGPSVPELTPSGEISEARVVMRAEPGFGKGRYELRISLIRAVPLAAITPSSSPSLAVTIVGVGDITGVPATRSIS